MDGYRGVGEKRGKKLGPNALKWTVAMMEQSINLGLEVNWLIFQHDLIR